MKRNIRITIEYDGSNYCGWQIQPELPTIQSELKKAIFNITKEDVTIIGSGRTDTGVHAKNQVAHFHTESSIRAEIFAKAINSQLPDDIVVKQSELVDLDFHAQYQAKAKAYSYTIFTNEHRPALNRNYVYWMRRSLDISLMREAASYLVGTHDFSSFEAAKSPRKSSIRTINKVDIQKQNCYITTLLEANGFLYKMVRNIMGTLIEVGYKKYSPTKVSEILKAKNRDFAGVTAPSHGLCLEYVLYQLEMANLSSNTFTNKCREFVKFTMNKRIALISDIHGNLEGFNAVLEDISRHNVDMIYCLGDVIGYGPNPVECLDKAIQCSEFILMGNHEEAVLTGAFGFNPTAKEAVDWTRSQLKPSWLSLKKTKKRWEVLKNLSLSYSEDDYLFVHGSPRDPTMEYILKSDTEDLFGEVPEKIREIFSQFNRACFVGHTHTPGIITEDSKWYNIEDFDGVWECKPGERIVCNIGSVGQPRDKDNRSCYVIFDGKEICYHRIPYDFRKTQEKILRIKQLDNRNAERLEFGN